MHAMLWAFCALFPRCFTGKNNDSSSAKPYSRQSRRFPALHRSAASLLLFACGCLALLIVSGCGSVAAGPSSPQTTVAGSNSSGSTSGTLVVSPSAVSFGSVAVGQTANATVSVTNSGTSSVQITQISLTGQSFSIPGQSNGSVTVAGGGTYQLSLQFAPTAAGPATGSLTLSSNAANGATQVVSLTGTGTDASTPATAALSALSCTNASLTGAGTDACTVGLNAAAPTGGLTVNLSSSDPAVTLPSTVTVPAGSSSASFTATAATVSAATSVTLTASAGGVTETDALQLNPASTGGTSTPALAVNATRVSFGTVNVNATATQTLTLTASGGSVTVNSVTATGAGFSMPGLTTPFTLQAGATKQLNVQFAPTGATSYTGQVSIASNASGSPITVTLTGTGQAASYEVDLTWTAPSSSTDTVTGYHIYRQLSGGSSQQLGSTSGESTTSYTDSSVQEGDTYAYYVVSVDASGNESTPSNTYTANIP